MTQNYQHLIEHVKVFLVESAKDDIERHEVYARFASECKSQKISEETFYSDILKHAYRGINWDEIEKRRKEVEEYKRQKEEEGKATALKNEIDKRQKKIAVKTAQKEVNLTALPQPDNVTNSARQTSADDIVPGKLKRQTIKLSIILGFIALVLICTYIWFNSLNNEDQELQQVYVFADGLNIRSAPRADVDNNIVATARYGDELNAKDTAGEWLEILLNDTIRYVNKKFVLGRSDFYILDGIFGDSLAKRQVPQNHWRKALLDYFKTQNYSGVIHPYRANEIYPNGMPKKEVWQIFGQGYRARFPQVYSERLYDPNSQYKEFACIIKNVKTRKRKCLIFTFYDDERSKMVFSEDATALGGIESVQYNTKKDKFKVVYR